MFYNVAQLLKQGVGATRRYEIHGDLCDIDEHNIGAVAVEGAVVMLRTPRGILATGTAQLRLNQVCRRCLEVTESQLALEFEEEFAPSIDIETGLKRVLTAEDEQELLIDEHHILDLTEVLRQYVVVAAAQTGLCRQDCKGLCPICGANLNLGPCGCDAGRVDPRLSVLAQWFDQTQDGNH